MSALEDSLLQAVMDYHANSKQLSAELKVPFLTTFKNIIFGKEDLPDPVKSTLVFVPCFP